MKWIFPLALLITFEFVADVLAKQWSVDRKVFLAAGALLSYTLANTFWLFALKNGSGLARGAVLFSIVSAIIAIAIGIILYKESVDKIQLAGLILGVISIGLLFWND